MKEKMNYKKMVQILINCRFSFLSVVVTSTPTNEAELQLYRVLQRASLLMYYDTLLEMGK